MSEKKIKIATLCCCYNRLSKTTSFLKSLIAQNISEIYDLHFYLLDDGSPDETGKHVQANFPMVQVIQGSGSLFWAGGMRTLWEHVWGNDSYDFYLLLNDDVVLSGDAITRLLAAYELSKTKGNVILGSVLDPQNDRISYGGRKIKNHLTGSAGILIPDKTGLRACELGNANIMLVDQYTVNRIGILSDAYTHGLADFDYTYTAVKSGLQVWVAPGYYGYCENDHRKTWLSGNISLKKRIEYLYSPKGLAYKEYLAFIKRHFPWMRPIIFFKLWIKTLFPFIYDIFKPF